MSSSSVSLSNSSSSLIASTSTALLADGIISGSVQFWARVGAGAGLGLGIEAVVSFPLLDDPTLALCLGCLVAFLLLLDISLN